MTSENQIEIIKKLNSLEEMIQHLSNQIDILSKNGNINNSKDSSSSSSSTKKKKKKR